MPKPGLYPKTPRPTASEAEKTVHAALKTHLPEGWWAWHSVRFRYRNSQECEIDFVLGVPEKGVIFLETKGGRVEVRGGHWYQNGRLMQPPRDQAHDQKRNFMTRMRELGAETIPWIGIACAFPETEFKEGPSADDVRDVVIGRQHLPKLRARLVEIARTLFTQIRPAPTDFAERVHDLFCETWSPSCSLGTSIELRGHDLVALDERQLELLDMIDKSDRMLVAGAPGSGKTLLARDLARRFEKRGKRSALVCFTSALARELRAEGANDAWTVRELAAEILAAGGVTMQDGARTIDWTEATWEEASAKAAELVRSAGTTGRNGMEAASPARATRGAGVFDAVRAGGYDFDAVIVDEGQDFGAADWQLIRAIAGADADERASAGAHGEAGARHAKKALWVFTDEGQAYWEERIKALPSELFPATFELQARYRCPAALTKFADGYRKPKKPARVRAAAGEGAEGDDAEAVTKASGVRCLKVRAVADDAAVEAEIARLIASAIEDGTAPGAIAVLSLVGMKKTALCAKDRIGGIDVVRADHPQAGTRVVADTFLRFKGLERPLLIVVELGKGRDRRYGVRMHIALTRATYACNVVGTEAEIAGDERLG